MKAHMKEFLKELKKSRTLLLMLAPAVIIIFIFAYLPMGGMVLAFKQYNYRDGIWGSPWVTGIFDNFRFFFMSGKAFAVTANTFSYNLCFIAVNTFLAVLFAVILSEARGKKFKKVTQSSIFLPYFVSWVIVGTIAYNLLNYENGVVNGVLKTLGMEPINLYADGPAWRVLIVLFNAWKSVGYSMVVYMAAVTGVDTQLHESAQIDGANIFQRIHYVTLPAIRPTIRPMRRQCELIGLSRPSPTVSITLRLITSNAGAKVPGITATNCSSIRVLSLFTLGSPL